MFAANLTEVLGGTEHQLVGNQEVDGEATLSFEEVMLDGANLAEAGIPNQTPVIDVAANLALPELTTELPTGEAPSLDVPAVELGSELIAATQFILSPNRPVIEPIDLPDVEAEPIAELAIGVETPLADVTIEQNFSAEPEVAPESTVVVGNEVVVAMNTDLSDSLTSQPNKQHVEVRVNATTDDVDVDVPLTREPAEQEIAAAQIQTPPPTTANVPAESVGVEVDATTSQAISQQAAVSSAPLADSIREIVDDEAADDDSLKIESVVQESPAETTESFDLTSQQGKPSAEFELPGNESDSVLQPTQVEVQSANFKATPAVETTPPPIAAPVTAPSIDPLPPSSLGKTAADPVMSMQPPEMTEQVISAVTQVIESPDGTTVKTVLLELQPAELGRLKIQVEQSAESIATHIIASELASSELLTAKKEALQAALSELGFDDASVDISHQQHQDAETQSQSRQASFRNSSTSSRQDTVRAEVDVHTSNGLNIVA